MTNIWPSPAEKFYCAEVLGIKNYLCPESIYSLRSLRGPIPCRFLAVIFKMLSPSQYSLLKKIMASINIVEFTVLEIKAESVFNCLIDSEERLADFICFFGGKDLVKKGSFIEKNDLLILKESSKENAEQNISLQNPSTSFLQVCSLEELDGSSKEVIHKKKQVWEQLKKWKKASGI